MTTVAEYITTSVEMLLLSIYFGIFGLRDCFLAVCIYTGMETKSRDNNKLINLMYVCMHNFVTNLCKVLISKITKKQRTNLHTSYGHVTFTV